MREKIRFIILLSFLSIPGTVFIALTSTNIFLIVFSILIDLSILGLAFSLMVEIVNKESKDKNIKEIKVKLDRGIR